MKGAGWRRRGGRGLMQMCYHGPSGEATHGADVVYWAPHHHAPLGLADAAPAWDGDAESDGDGDGDNDGDVDGVADGEAEGTVDNDGVSVTEADGDTEAR